MSNGIHRLTNKDIELREADCSECNTRVRIYKTTGSYMCAIKHASLLKGRKRPNRNRLPITKDAQAKLLESQNGKCAICLKELTKKYLDHDHSCCPSYTKQCGKCVREYLCLNCNTALGHFQDNTELMRSAIAYIERHLQSSEGH